MSKGTEIIPLLMDMVINLARALGRVVKAHQLTQLVKSCSPIVVTLTGL